MTRVKSYSGIGSRKTPKDVQLRMIEYGMELGEEGYILRSGAAVGADAAFESGCDHVGGLKEIYLPWEGYNGHPSPLFDTPELAFYVVDDWWPHVTAENHHGARLMYARNLRQVLGPNLDDPVDFVLCWTEGGRMLGGTRIAMEVAQHFDIPIINLGRPEKADTVIDLFDW